MSVPHHGFLDDPPPLPAGYFVTCTGLPDCPVHSVGAGVCPQLAARHVDLDVTPFRPIVEAFATMADRRFTVHGGRLWCLDDGSHDGFALARVAPDRPAARSVTALVDFLLTHWECGR